MKNITLYWSDEYKYRVITEINICSYINCVLDF